MKKKSIYSVSNNLHQFYLQSFSKYDSAVAVITSLVQCISFGYMITCIFCIPGNFVYCTCVFKVCGMDQLWSIALKANNTDVSMTAIQILNNYYINYGNGHLEKEAEFIQRCMDNLTIALTDIESVSVAHKNCSVRISYSLLFISILFKANQVSVP